MTVHESQRGRFRMSRSGTRIVACVALLMLLAAACGGEADPVAEGDQDVAATSAPDGPEPEASEPETQTEEEPAAEETPYYAGKEVEAVIPFSPGGGTDNRMRYMAEWFTRYIPGNPTIVPVNIEGGGGLAGSNEWFARQDRNPDGTSIMISSSGAVNLPLLFGNPNIQFDINKMVPVAVIPSGSAFYVHPSTGIETPEDLLDPAEPLVLAEQSPAGTGLRFLIAFEMLGADVDTVFGYDGRGPARIAFEQGESNVNWDSESAWNSDVEPLIEAGEAIPLFAFGQLDAEGNVIRDPIWPDLPTGVEVYEMIHGEEPSGPIFEAYKTLIAATSQFTSGIWLHADAPEEAIQAWSDAAAQMNDDPEFWESGGREAVGAYDIITGDAVMNAFEGVRNPNPEGVEWMLNYLEEEHQVTFD